MTRAPAIEVVALSEEWKVRYFAFARKAYGADAYQASRAYIRWLYDEGPYAAEGVRAAKIAVRSGRVIGCFHKLHAEWCVAGELVRGCAPHNLMVDEAYRTGTGLALIAEAFKREAHLFLIGAGPAVAPIYERMRAVPVESFWLRGILNPFSAPIALGLGFFSRLTLDRLIDLAHVHATRASPCGRCVVRHSLDAVDVSEVLACLNRGEETRLVWTDDFLRWRCFSSGGPRHLIFHIEGKGAVAIVALGATRSLLVARIVAWRASAEVALPLARHLRRTLMLLGFNVWTVVTSSDDARRVFEHVGLRASAAAPRVYALHRPQVVQASSRVSLDGAASDYGFDAIPYLRAERVNPEGTSCY